MKEDWFVPYKYRMVEKITIPFKEKRLEILQKAGYNMFDIKAEDVYIDLLTDSGTGTMSNIQWSKIILGDESYAGSESFFAIKNAVEDLMGIPFVMPAHQGRAAEKVLNSVMIKSGQFVPGNTHFDTTKGHIELVGGRAVDLTIDESADSAIYHPFKGNIDLNKLEAFINEHKRENIAYVLLTITCNSGGGQPVSLENIEEAHKIAKKNGIPLFFDAARFAENAYFIKKRENKYKTWTIKEIVKKMFSLVEGFTMSSKKDAIVPMGGLIGVRSEELFNNLKTPTILNEGYLTYGGMSGMVMNALAQGLHEVTDYDYLHYRISQVKMLGDVLLKANIPIVEPIGGHAVFLDGRKFYPNMPENEFPAQYLTAALYEAGGVRPIEVGANLIGRDPDTGENIIPKLDLCRLAIPRRTYSYEHMMYTAETIKEVYETSSKITTGLKIDIEGTGIRHFSTSFKLVDPNKKSLL
jgi:tryptophanase